MIWNWSPNMRVNNLFFDEEISTSAKEKLLCSLEAIPFFADGINDEMWKSKKYGVIISFDSQITTKFTGIEVWKNLFFDNQLLIGLTENEIKKIFYFIDDWQFDENGDFIQSYELDALFWMENGMVESVSL